MDSQTRTRVPVAMAIYLVISDLFPTADASSRSGMGIGIAHPWIEQLDDRRQGGTNRASPVADAVLLLHAEFSHGETQIGYQKYRIIPETTIPSLIGDDLSSTFSFK